MKRHLRIVLFIIFAFIIFISMAGWRANFQAAMMYAFLYTIGFGGFLLMLKSKRLKQRDRRWFYLIIGFFVVVFAWQLLEMQFKKVDKP